MEGELGWHTPNDFAEPFASVVRGLKPSGLYPEPVQTKYGWHVIEVMQTRGMRMAAYEEIKGRIEARLRFQPVLE